ncbi:signal peptidase I [bacterium]|nr:signal peptidase I [bacterium]
MNCGSVEFLELSKDILSQGACLRFQAKGGSMYPAIRDGDILNVEPVKVKDIRLGDVIFYRTAGERMVAHRVIKKLSQNDRLILVTKGDSNTGKEEEVILEEILGRVKAIERYGRRICLNQGLGRLMDIFYAKISPLIRRLRRIGGRLLRQIQGFKTYRNLAKRLIKGEIFYQLKSSEGSGNYLLAKRGNRVVGKTTVSNFLESNSRYHGWWIFGMWVNWRYRGLGIGGRLTKIACDSAAESGASEIKLLVFKDNKPASNLYRKMGFCQIFIPEIDGKLREEARKTRRQRIIMAKDIQNEIGQNMFAKDRLIRYCARIDIDENIAKKIKHNLFGKKGKIEKEYLVSLIANSGRKDDGRVENGFDWDYLLDEARKNGVSPLLYFYQKEEKENFPKDFFKGLEKDYYQTLTRNILIWEEIKPILKSLEEKKIEVILLKGIALGVTIYPSVGLRPMSDVDILIKDEDIFKVNEILNNFGYFPGDINPRDIELGKTEYLTTLYYRGKNLSLHLHWHLVNSTIPNFSYISRINMDRIWQKARLIEISEIKALILSPEHLIIYLCEHSLRVTHSLSRLIFLADISQAINYYQDKIDWDFLVKESYNFGLERMVYCGLYSVNRILGTEVPSDVLSSLKPKRLTSGEKIFLSLVAKNRSSPGLSYLVHLAMNKKLSEKIKFLFRTLFPPKKVLGQRNCIPPSKINYLHYFFRLKRVLRHVLISILH